VLSSFAGLFFWEGSHLACLCDGAGNQQAGAHDAVQRMLFDGAAASRRCAPTCHTDADIARQRAMVGCATARKCRRGSRRMRVLAVGT